MTDAVPVRNLFYLFAYAWNMFPFAREADSGEDPGPDGTALLTRVLLTGLVHQMRRGLDRVYVGHEEEIAGVRGRIDVTRTLTGSLFERARTISRYDELEYDSLANRLLKAVVRQCSADKAVPAQLRREAMSILRTFDAAGVRDTQPAWVMPSTQLNRNNRRYRFLLHVAELLLRKRFPAEDGSAGPFSAALRDHRRMAALFEKFLLNFYRAEQSEFSAQAENVAWKVAATDDLSAELMPVMKTDIILRSVSRTIIIDAKFYRKTLQKGYGRATVRSDHLYQLFSYIKNLQRAEAPIVEGLLIYPTVQRHLTLGYRIDGHPIGVCTIDLTAPWPLIAERLLSLLKDDL